MAPHASEPGLLLLQALRLTGFAALGRLASRFRLDTDLVEELLLDFEAHGWASRSGFAGSNGWALTEAGRREGERLLAAELDGCGARAEVALVHRSFLPLNARFSNAVTRWQLRPAPGDPMAPNDHTKFRWEDGVIDDLEVLGRRVAPLCARLTAVLARFDGYQARYAAAMDRVRLGQGRWVDGVGFDSCHTVWFELHEDLLATLGILRADEVP